MAPKIISLILLLEYRWQLINTEYGVLRSHLQYKFSVTVRLPIVRHVCLFVISVLLTMSNSSYWKRPLTLFELLAELENDEDAVLPEEIVIFRPENANEGCDTDEVSGDENVVEPNNLPGAQLLAEIEVQMPSKLEEELGQAWDSDDDKPLSTFVERRPKK
ncbi:hypothetical protein JTB14_032203 [Gonioctena quinquepunctata]|nr:hypothetical protein JTB14_032203 [Gonioctena quinquepunctata]